MAGSTSTSASPIRAYLRNVMTMSDRLYAVVDAARNRELAFAARDRFGLRLHTLFDGELARHLDHVAPQLVPMDGDSAYLELWTEHLGDSCGILLLSEVSAEILRAHLRRIFVVTDEQGEEFSFRYYDPRVLRVYLPTCTIAEVWEFFGPIKRILVESDQPRVILSYGIDRQGLSVMKTALATQDATARTEGGHR